MDKETLELIERLEQIHEESLDAIKSTQNSLSICQIILTAATVINVATVFLTLPDIPDSLKFVVLVTVTISSLVVICKL